MISGKASVFGNARVFDDAWGHGSAHVYGNAWIVDDVRVGDYAVVAGNDDGRPAYPAAVR